MLKIKLFACLSILGLVAIVLSNSPALGSKSEDDAILREIAGYKNWAKLMKDPLKIDISSISVAG